MVTDKSKVTRVREVNYGVCLWEMPDGSYLGDGDNNFLSLDGLMGDFWVESKMRKAAIYWAGEEAAMGRPAWMEGARKLTDSEYDDQKARMESGMIPDWEDEARQVILRGKQQ